MVIYHVISISSSLKIACFICNHIVWTTCGWCALRPLAGGERIMRAPGLNKSNAASLPLRTETSYLEPNAAQTRFKLKPFSAITSASNSAFSSRLSNQVWTSFPGTRELLVLTSHLQQASMPHNIPFRQIIGTLHTVLVHDCGAHPHILIL